ncbi:MAG: hypothetical protein KatS3mg002_0217 [Candidatus Woesearchaeota archaeon]|nr:MAG: hypothetical protein KatS3mg002_0217 [Candidatus Woesearchaeota archaeon]
MNKITVIRGSMKFEFNSDELVTVDLIPDGVVFNFKNKDFYQVNFPFLNNQAKEALVRLKNLNGNLVVDFNTPETLVKINLKK